MSKPNTTALRIGEKARRLPNALNGLEPTLAYQISQQRLLPADRQSDRLKVDIPSYVFPRRFEPLHMLLCGGTGSGKTQFIKMLLNQIVPRGDKGLAVDHGSELMSGYFRPGDINFNLLDKRFPGWCPFNEISDFWDFDTLARMVIPDGASSQEREWHRYAQSCLSSIMGRCHQFGMTTNAELLEMLTVAPRERLAELLTGDPTAQFFSKENEKMGGSIRAIITQYTRPWKFMNAGTFSIREWVLDDSNRSWLWIGYRDSTYPFLRSFISMATSIAVTFAMDLSEDRERRFFFITDELATLDPLAMLSEALAKIRKRGGCVLSGVQTLSQLREKYGHDGAQTLLSNFSTKIALRTFDVAIAKEFSEYFGEFEHYVETISEGQSSGKGTSMNSGSSFQLKTSRVVTPGELIQMPERQGIIQMPGLPAGEINIPIVETPVGFGTEPFISRKGN